MRPHRNRTWRRAPGVIALAVLSIVALTLEGGVANAKGGGGGGTAKPPPGAVAPFVEPTLPDPAFSTDPLNIHQFDVIGFLQDATLDTTNTNCPNTANPAVGGPNLLGGTATLNGVKIIVPCNMTIQMPANTFTWADFVNPAQATPPITPAPPVTLKAGAVPSFEMHVQGNIVAGKHIAGLMFFSQQSLNAGQGYITAINYTDGSFTVDTGDPANPAKVQLNDPKLTDALGHRSGRFSAGQSPDPRLSVDQANPTVHAHTGYPMCIPRTDPKTADDPLCPQQNRPLTSAAGGCRNFSVCRPPGQRGAVTPARGPGVLQRVRHEGPRARTAGGWRAGRDRSRLAPAGTVRGR